VIVGDLGAYTTTPLFGMGIGRFLVYKGRHDRAVEGAGCSGRGSGGEA